MREKKIRDFLLRARASGAEIAVETDRVGEAGDEQADDEGAFEHGAAPDNDARTMSANRRRVPM